MLHQEYRNPAFRQFRDELTKAPREQRMAQVDRAERLMSELISGDQDNVHYVVISS